MISVTGTHTKNRVLSPVSILSPWWTHNYLQRDKFSTSESDCIKINVFFQTEAAKLCRILISNTNGSIFLLRVHSVYWLLSTAWSRLSLGKISRKFCVHHDMNKNNRAENSRFLLQERLNVVPAIPASSRRRKFSPLKYSIAGEPKNVDILYIPKFIRQRILKTRIKINWWT